MSTQAQRQPSDTGPSDYQFTDKDFSTISEMLFAETGIYMPDGKKMLMYSRLTKRLRKLNLRSFDEYIALVSSGAGVDERKNMITALTTNVTRFFREPHHFEHFNHKLLPEMINRARKGEKIRIWSSACSNGQEPYSIAMAILDQFPNAADWDFKILASDIDTNMLAEARNGVYDEHYLSLVPKTYKTKFFEKLPDAGDKWRVVDDVRKLISFKELNLMSNWPMKGGFDLIFCRNVVIYFQMETQIKLWKRFLDVTNPGGWLYVGHSERVAGPAADDYISQGATIYQKRG